MKLIVRGFLYKIKMAVLLLWMKKKTLPSKYRWSSKSRIIRLIIDLTKNLG